MGDSITEYWGDLHPTFFTGKPYVNRGISGETTTQMLTRFSQDVVNLEPRIVVILGGINDIAGRMGYTSIEAIFDNIVSMAELAVRNNIKVVLCSVLPANKFLKYPTVEPAELVVNLNALLNNYAEANGIEYVNYYPSMVDDEGGLQFSLGEDGVHPNVDGYLIMEPLLESTLEKVRAQQ